MKYFLGALMLASVAIGGFVYSNQPKRFNKDIVQHYDRSKSQREQLYDLCLASDKMVIDSTKMNLTNAEYERFLTVMDNSAHDRCACTINSGLTAAEGQLGSYPKIMNELTELAILSANLQLNKIGDPRNPKASKFQQKQKLFIKHIESLDESKEINKRIAKVTEEAHIKADQCKDNKKVSSKHLKENIYFD